MWVVLRAQGVVFGLLLFFEGAQLFVLGVHFQFVAYCAGLSPMYPGDGVVALQVARSDFVVGDMFSIEAFDLALLGSDLIVLFGFGDPFLVGFFCSGAVVEDLTLAVADSGLERVGHGYFSCRLAGPPYQALGTYSTARCA